MKTFISPVYCKDCIYRPRHSPSKFGADLIVDETICPFGSEDPYMATMPPDDFFCKNAASALECPPERIR